MELVEIYHNGNCVEDASHEQLLSVVSSGTCNIAFEDPEIHPQVGDQYQVEIPPLITECDPLLLTDKPTGVKDSVVGPYEFLMGLPVSIMWVSTEGEKIKIEPVESPVNSIDVSNKNQSVKSECVLESHRENGDLKPKLVAIDSTPAGEKNLQESENLALQQEMKIEMHQKYRSQDHFAVPGTPVGAWNDLEEASVLLGLYIFGKNFVQVKKFVQSKNMGDILSFYYGKFYRSDKYRRWSECRKKMRRRQCIYGQRIFTGWRQQVLLSRLLPHVSEECQSTLLEVSKAFGEGKILLEEYIVTLKATVGLNALVSAVGIGKGKEDLTGIAMEPPKSSQVAPVRPEIPVGKACSALTPLEIVNFLTGNYRLSKARSNDLFWEAVWPRLLARGWHSEQPTSQRYTAGSKHSLVFLIPGVKKFSRRKLVKGDHYFDCVSDVLSKVAFDPGLLELEIGSDKGDSSKEENGTESDRDDIPDQQRHCYLKPRGPSHGAEADVMRFTVVDTSLDNGGKCKVRELRSLPIEMNISNSLSESEESTSEEVMDESDSADTSGPDTVETNGLKPAQISYDQEVSPDANTSNNKFPVDGQGSSNVLPIPEDPKTKVCNGMQPRKAMKNQSSQKMKLDNNNHLFPVTKRCRRLTACNRKEKTQKARNILVGPGLKQAEASCREGNPNGSAIMPSEVYPFEQQLSSVSPSSKGSPTSRGEGFLRSTCAEQTREEHQHRMLIDLNLPVLPVAETDDPFMGEVTETEHEHTTRQPDNASELEARPSSELQPNMTTRRQSTRNRPPTTKALEALACGFLSTTQKRKRRDSLARENYLSRASHRACDWVKVSENNRDVIANFKAEEQENGMCNSNGAVEQTSNLTQMDVDSNLGVSIMSNSLT